MLRFARVNSARLQRTLKFRSLSFNPAAAGFYYPYPHLVTDAKLQFLQIALKRFYTEVGIRQTSGGYAIELDGLAVKTPLRRQLLIPSQPLAAAISAEWDGQQKEIRPSEMHLTSLCMTAIDKLDKTTAENQVNDILPFLRIDCTCFRVSEPDDFVKLQSDTWDPIIEWFQNLFTVQLKVSSGLLEPFQDAETTNKMKNVLMSFSQHTLLGVHSLASSLSSLVIAMSLVNDCISVQKAVEAADIETEYQTRKWGTVEWSHTISCADTTARVAAAALFIKHYRPES